MGPGELDKILSKLPKIKNDNLLVGYDSSDDAAVYKLDEKNHLIATLDFFSPMVDDPRLFGKIAAANALSDIYAMGATPLFALNIVCFPEKLGLAPLEEMLLGGSEKLIEAGATLAGGHSVYDPEIKYGLSVTGLLGEKILYNNTAQVGDLIILTKPLGVGIIMAAHRVGHASEKAYEAATKSMERLNKYAAEIASTYPVTAATDITGFGLLVHMQEMATCHSIKIFPDSIPYIEEAYEYAKDFYITGAAQRNRNFFGNTLDHLDAPLQEILFDPQTSGGLVFSIPKEDAARFLKDLQKVEPLSAMVGEVVEKQEKSIIT